MLSFFCSKSLFIVGLNELKPQISVNTLSNIQNYKMPTSKIKRSVTVLLVCFLMGFPGYAQFVTIWKTDNLGTSGESQVTIPA